MSGFAARALHPKPEMPSRESEERYAVSRPASRLAIENHTHVAARAHATEPNRASQSVCVPLAR